MINQKEKSDSLIMENEENLSHRSMKRISRHLPTNSKSDIIDKEWMNKDNFSSSKKIEGK